jgi:GntR family transcriptional regulator, trigonelline degradation regulator
MEVKLVRISAPLRAQVEEALRRAIADGQLNPGARLVERELCEKFSISRTLLREALRQLEAERLIETIPNRGMVVATPTLSDALQLFQVRAELEGLASRIVAESGSAQDHAQLKKALDVLKDALAAGCMKTFRVRKNEFYATLITVSRNEVLGEILSVLHNRIQLFRGASLAEPGRAEDAVAELDAIVSAIEARNGREAQLLTARHMQNAARVLAQILARAASRTLSEEELAAISSTLGLQPET